MPLSCHFQGCKALLLTGKRHYIKYHAFAFAFAFFHSTGGGWNSNPRPVDRKSGTLPLRHRAPHSVKVAVMKLNELRVYCTWIMVTEGCSVVDVVLPSIVSSVIANFSRRLQLLSSRCRHVETCASSRIYSRFSSLRH